MKIAMIVILTAIAILAGLLIAYQFVTDPTATRISPGGEVIVSGIDTWAVGSIDYSIESTALLYLSGPKTWVLAVKVLVDWEGDSSDKRKEALEVGRFALNNNCIQKAQKLLDDAGNQSKIEDSMVIAFIHRTNMGGAHYATSFRHLLSFDDIRAENE